MQASLLRAVRVVLDEWEDSVLVQDMTQLGYYSRNYWPTYRPRSFMTSSPQITLGCSWPLALGAKLGRPGAAVVALVGDGGWLYNMQELATAVQHGIPAVAIGLGRIVALHHRSSTP